MAVVSRFLLIILGYLIFTVLVSADRVLAASSYTVPEVKIFNLRQKEVIAVAVEERQAANAVADPLQYMLQPRYQTKMTDAGTEVILFNAAAGGLLREQGMSGGRFEKNLNGVYLKKLVLENTGDGQMRLFVYFPAGIQPQVSLVKRKRVLNPNNTITFRTYVVISVGKTAGAPAPTIVLDPGHGGRRLGATSNYLYEKELNLDIALLARDLLLQKGFDAYMTRTDDSATELLDAADAANILGADVFISIHNNSFPENLPEPDKKLYRGTTVLYNSSAVQPAKDLAIIMCDELVNALNTYKCPLQDRPNLVVLNATWVPAVIAEVAMMPHPQDAKMISQRIYRLQAAEAIVSATEKYFAFRCVRPAADKGGK